MQAVKVIGAGLAGCEAAWQLARRGIPVELYEMKPLKTTPAHHSADFAELVCSNSLRSDQLENAVGLLKEELRRMGSLILACADQHRVPAGGALAVDRQAFSAAVTQRIRSYPNITVIEGEITEIPPEGDVIVASGPLTSDALSQDIARHFPGSEYLHFFDAAAPIVTFESIDMSKAWFASRYDRGTPDYINCPMNQEEYDRFWTELTGAKQAQLHEFDDGSVFEGCMPVEVMARRGRDTLCYGPLKPVGLPDPRTGKEPFAVVQLRKDNAAGSIYNIVGFQTHLTFPEQKRVFSLIPGLEQAEFVRYGVMHRNTYLHSPGLLNHYYQVIGEPRLCFAGQMTGVEGYVESAACGILAGINLGRYLSGRAPASLPLTTMLGSLIHYVSTSPSKNFQPMGSNMGLLPPLEEPIREKAARYEAMARRGLADLDRAVEEQGLLDVLC